MHQANLAKNAFFLLLCVITSVCVRVCVVWVKKRKEGESGGERGVVTEVLHYCHYLSPQT